MDSFSALYHLLKYQDQHSPNHPALFAPHKDPLSYHQLFGLVNNTIQFLHEHNLGCNDAIAIVLPNGPEMAMAFLAVASCATAAPLNPNYRLNEFDFYFTDLNAQALITLKGWDTPARHIASEKGISIFELEPVTQTAGNFVLHTLQQNKNSLQSDLPQSEDIALILHTSGTTSRPKMVPLSQQNICISAENIRQSLQLTASDLCLNIMPLFHIHGLCASLLASLSAGASIVCTPGFYAPDFFEWMNTFQPTWYTAVPTMHQSILKRTTTNHEKLEKSRLRFIRSCSASLPPQVMFELEKIFNVPVLEAYGMTEAAHQICSNPFPPRQHKPGSVGTAAGPQVAIMAEDEENFLPAETRGEVVLRGLNITSGYAQNPEANSRSFTPHGWFRTGDQGYLDQEGYLFLTGRIKEMINRGGEKISPREIDEALLNHPAVAQAVAFALPDAKLGESVAAAVVLKTPGLTEKELRLFVAENLADFKVPEKIVFLDEIPKGPTGKIQRIGLAEKLGLQNWTSSPSEPAPVDSVTPTPMQDYLLGLWRSTLRMDQIEINSSFLEMGGDSVLAASIISSIKDQLGLQMSPIEFFDSKSISAQAILLEEKLLNS